MVVFLFRSVPRLRVLSPSSPKLRRLHEAAAGRARTDLLLLHSSRELVDRGGVPGLLRAGLVLVVVSCRDLLGLHHAFERVRCGARR